MSETMKPEFRDLPDAEEWYGWRFTFWYVAFVFDQIIGIICLIIIKLSLSKAKREKSPKLQRTCAHFQTIREDKALYLDNCVERPSSR